ncbi:MAG: hypothetical protein NVV60_01440 [Luteimonas sp.]|nr:hypothetical protein [Luteimonas sp.]
MVGPFPAESVMQRLKATVPLAKIIGNAADLDTALQAQPNTSPALYVVIEERGSPPKYTGNVVIQNMDVMVKVITLVRNASGERLGTGARKAADDVIAETRNGLIGWTPADAFNALYFVAGRDDRFHGSWLTSQQIFRTDYRIQKQATP